MNRFIIYIFFLLTVISCNSDKSTESSSSPVVTATDSKIQFKSLSAQSTGVAFENKVIETPKRNILTYEYMYNGAGVALADFDNDGWTDIFFTGNDVENKVYKNLGKMKFEDVSQKALKNSGTYSMGATLVDINDDGFMDIYVSNSGPEKDGRRTKNQLLVNNGDFTFTDKAKQYGLDLTTSSVQAEFFDYDNDGDLDFWLNNHNDIATLKRVSEAIKDQKGSNWDNLNKLKTKEIVDSKIQFFRNDNGKYTDISEQAGVDKIAFGLGLSVADYNQDGFLDVYVANDYWIPDYYFLNDQKGGFVDRSDVIGHMSYYGMGCDASDYNNDGVLDLVVVDMTPSDHVLNKTLMESMNVNHFYTLSDYYNFPKQYMFNSFQVGIGNGFFSEIGNALKMSLTGWSWAPLFFDMNNNGRKDLYITNGFYRDTKNQDFITQSNNKSKELGHGYTFDVQFNDLQNLTSRPIKNKFFQTNDAFGLVDITEKVSASKKSFSNGAAYADLDKDGDLDLVINNLNSAAEILENTSDKQNWLRIKLKSKKEAQIKNSQITITTTEGKQHQDYKYVRGYLSSVEPIVHFGIGRATVSSIEIKWPNNSKSVISNPQINKLIELDYDALAKTAFTKPQNATPFVDASQLIRNSGIRHRETVFNDFEKEILLPQKYSTLGPPLAVGDIDGDGFDDFYLGGSKDDAGQLYSMKGNSFVKLSENVFQADKSYEDIGATFFDANGDGRIDLYVSSGGGGEVADENLLQDRLYLNQGNGSFVKSSKALPKINSSTKSIVPFDYDGDKDLDLFVGGRNKPGGYPQKASSYLLENKNGIFSNVITEAFQSDLPNMVTDAEITDLDGDAYPDLVVSGEWSTPKFYVNDGKGRFTPKTFDTASKENGWWYSVSQGDLNSDGKQDYVFGNLGQNNKFHSNKENPLVVYYEDFDANGSLDIVLTKDYKGKRVPVRGKECSSEQMPVINDRFSSYNDFANASIFEILGDEKIQASSSLEANNFNSIVMLSRESGYTIQNLPDPAQWSPILDSEVIDVNGDGHLDVIVAGKMEHAEPETPSYDAGKGLILYGNGKGDFECNPLLTSSGLNMKYNTKDIEILKRPNGYGLLASNNNNFVELYIKR